jgi:hypothetical protein
MIRGCLLGAVVIALGAGALSAPAGAVPTTTSTCNFTVQPPAVLAMQPAVQAVPTTVTADCSAAASYSLSVDFAGSDSYNSQTSFGPLHYDQANGAASFDFTSCPSSDFSNNGHYAAKLVSATVKDGMWQPISNVQLQPSSTVAINSSYAYAASSRQGDAVYLNGLIKEYGFEVIGALPSLGFGCGLFRHANGTVYLQRLLNGAWQTMLSRTSDDQGAVSVGFVQHTAYSYRWVVLSEPASPAGSSGMPDGLVGAVSASTVR